jgi:uracil-DNA glycosylase/DNA polymerase I-like protein with 3'-5' exonuclease and polymerase domains
MICLPEGPVPASIMLVGEAPGEHEEAAGTPFVGVSGQELNRMLHEAGIMRSECFVTNVCRVRPPNNDLGAFVAMKKKDITPAHQLLLDRWCLPPVHEGYALLFQEIERVRPQVIIAFGNLALWALTGAWGVTKWRGSILGINGPYRGEGPVVVPTYHPAAILRQWEWRAAGLSDLRRAKRCLDSEYRRPPVWTFQVRPDFVTAKGALTGLLDRLAAGETWIDFDLETRAGHIACAGLSWSTTEAICIPFMCVENREGYWSVDEEAELVFLLYQVLNHRNARIRWQNGLYDAQYTHRHWHFVPRGAQDTMISQHTLWCTLPKSLAFQASLYSPHYVYWKDDGKTWAEGMGEDQLWTYNCVDCIRTREVGEAELQAIAGMGLQAVEEFQQRLFWPVLRAMIRGIRVDEKAASDLAMQLMDEIAKREAYILAVAGHALNPKSPKQMIQFFYGDLGQKPIWSRPKKGQPSHITCDDEALQTIASREPLLKPLVNAIADIRTLSILLSTFVNAKRDIDGRMRCSFNIAGNTETDKSAPATYRLSSSENAFGSGCNLQTIPSDKSKSMGKMMKRGIDFEVPNIRRMYAPDPGYLFFDGDLDRADLQAMAWDAEDDTLKAVLRANVDVHLFNVYVLDNQEPPPLEELVEGHPKYPDHRGPRKHKREFAKVFCHATDYLGKSRTVAAVTGRTVHEVDRAQAIYLGRYKGIKKWQDRVIEQVRKRHYVENAWGYRWYIFSRIDDSVMPEAVAWIPQSTVGVTINKIWMNFYEKLPEVEVLLQVHDSLAGQLPAHRAAELLPRMEQESRIVIPYADPLIIPFSIKTSPISWGDCA